MSIDGISRPRNSFLGVLQPDLPTELGRRVAHLPVSLRRPPSADAICCAAQAYSGKPLGGSERARKKADSPLRQGLSTPKISRGILTSLGIPGPHRPAIAALLKRKFQRQSEKWMAGYIDLLAS